MAPTFAAEEVARRAEELFRQGEFAPAAQLLSDGIAMTPSALLWNDWGAVQVCLGQLRDAERGFRAALQLDPTSIEAMENLGTVLVSRGAFSEAAHFLRQVLPCVSPEKRQRIEGILAKCPETGTPAAGLTHVGLPLLAQTTKAETSGATWDSSRSYEEWCRTVFRQPVPVPGVRVAGSWREDTEWGSRAVQALFQVECDCARELLKEIHERNIEGDIAEFGIFTGGWINFLFNTTEQIGLYRRIYGFDSFEGLSEPHPEHDEVFWKKGQYACSLEEVTRNVQAASRPRIKLVKGFFETSLRGADALIADKFAYVRIDCDIYLPALDCLRYLGPRLADGAILVFDDWPHVRGLGEQRAFEEWLPSVPHLEFEFLFYGIIGHFYTRVHHKRN